MLFSIIWTIVTGLVSKLWRPVSDWLKQRTEQKYKKLYQQSEIKQIEKEGQDEANKPIDNVTDYLDKP